MNATPTKLPVKYRNRINKQLDNLCRNNYFQSIPLKDIAAILAPFELKIEDGIYCGDGETYEEVGHGVWFRMSWYKMPSGRYEIVAYVS